MPVLRQRLWQSLSLVVIVFQLIFLDFSDLILSEENENFISSQFLGILSLSCTRVGISRIIFNSSGDRGYVGLVLTLPGRCLSVFSC